MERTAAQSIIHSLNEQVDRTGTATAGHWLARRPEKPRVLAIIPARGGSKGLPRKNARLLCGKPLVAYSIEAALAAPLVDRVVVSTDDPEIEAIARAYGPDIALRRPVALADDRAIIGDVVEHAKNVTIAQGFRPDFLVTLYPTHPFRPRGMIDRLTAVGLLEGRDVMTVRAIDTARTPYCARQDGAYVPVCDPHQGPWYRPYGLYIGQHVQPAPRVYLHELRDPSELVDIDYLEDFLYAEALLASGLVTSHDAVC